MVLWLTTTGAAAGTVVQHGMWSGVPGSNRASVASIWHIVFCCMPNMQGLSRKD